MADRFYVNCPLAPGVIEITGSEAHHLAVVCRLRPGHPVCLFNGNGHEYPASIVKVNRQSVTLDVLSVYSPARELGFRLEVAAPLPKGDRAQFLIEKLTELGVTAFIPLRTERSVVHPREGKLEKLERSVIEASKQCRRTVLLRIEPLARWEAYCSRVDLPGSRIVAHIGEASAAPKKGTVPLISERQSPFSEVALAVGPEGGFTEEEIAMARISGWEVVGLGPRTLRVETAALVLAVSAVYGE